MRASRNVAWIAAVLCLFGGASAAEKVTFLSMEEVVNLTNDYRAARGLGELRINYALAEAADAQARHQAIIEGITHSGPRKEGLGERLKKVRYRPALAAENVSMGRQTEEKVVDAWIRSPSHHRALIEPGVTEIGVGAALGPDGRVYWSMILADPLQ